MVGRLAPNKGHLALIKSFEIYNRVYNSSSRLLIVGKEDERLINYNTAVRGALLDLQLKDKVVMTGGISFQALKSYYLVAHTFMTTSEHEGFCVPIVEAMSMKIPVVAYGSSAIPDTVGDSGIVWDELDPYLLAGSLNCIASQPHIQRELGSLGWHRYQKQFTNETIASNFLRIIQSL
jgi:glycosyltransferase involved in cell wall biosynthesis